MESVEEILALQSGVVARRQLIARGWADHDIARMLRKRLWATLHDGVYVDHTGEPSWIQQAWAAVLFSWPAALSHGSCWTAGQVGALLQRHGWTGAPRPCGPDCPLRG